MPIADRRARRLPLRRAVRALRAQATRSRRLLIVATSLCLALIVALGVFALDRPAPDPVYLGEGFAGVAAPGTVTEAAPSDPLRADEVEAESEAPPPSAASPYAPGQPVAGGEASFYGAELAGRPTASGERFNPEALTAAHRTLPLGSTVRVTNLRNGQSVVVRINDRGPFHGNRVIDLSRRAAQELGFQRRGTARVQIELLRRS